MIGMLFIAFGYGVLIYYGGWAGVAVLALHLFIMLLASARLRGPAAPPVDVPVDEASPPRARTDHG